MANVFAPSLEYVQLDTLVVARITACPKATNVVVPVSGLADLVTIVVVWLCAVQYPRLLRQFRGPPSMRIPFIFMRMPVAVMLMVVVLMIRIMVVQMVVVQMAVVQMVAILDYSRFICDSAEYSPPPNTAIESHS